MIRYTASLWNLSYNNDENRERLGKAGACEICCELLRAHGPTSSDVAEEALRCCAQLLFNNKARISI